MSDYPRFTREQLHSFDELPGGVLVNVVGDDHQVRYAYSNDYLAHSLGYTHKEFSELLTADCFAAIYELDKEKTQNVRTAVMEGRVMDSISRQKKKDGSYVWILAHVRRIELDGQIAMLFLFSGIQELIGLQDELKEKNQTWEDMLTSFPIGLLVFKSLNNVNTVISVNRFLVDFANAVGSQLDQKHRNWSEAQMAVILNQDLYAFCENEDVPKVRKMLEDSEIASITNCVYRLRGSGMTNPVYIYATCTSKPTEDGGRTYYVSYQDVTEVENQHLELIEKQKQLFDLSYHDALTGVMNRNAYNEYVGYCRKHHIYDVGVAFCDVNGLKSTNDTLGHYYGDRMLCGFANMVKEFFPVDEIYRISGDEFVIIEENTTTDAFKEKMDKMIAKIHDEGDLASIGYIWKRDVSDIQRRTMQAEQIMYVEKQRFYEANRMMTSKHRPLFLASLLTDFEEGRFSMYLQPKTTMEGDKVIGAEALARKFDENGKMILPYEFVPQLEHEKLIPKLDFYILEKACEFLQKQHLAGKDDFSVSVNISRVTIVENDFLKTVVEILGKYDFLHSNLEFELTESSETMDAIRLEEYMLQLKKFGIKISLDDMGTDYSTLTLLIMEGFDWVKLDRSIVLKLGQQKTQIILKHIISMCHDLSLHVIAEGVENDEDRLALAALGCDAYQGYLKSKPIPATEFEERFLQ